MAQCVPDTIDFTLLDVVAVVGGANLEECFANSVDAFFDPIYKGDKSTLLNFRHYCIIPPAPPTVTTNTITAILSTTATGGGNVTSEGATAVTVRGICWNTTGNPTTGNSKTINGSGAGAFVSSLTTLLPSTLYYVRAYAKNSAGISYGNQVSFTTTAPPVGLPVVYTQNVVLITRISANVNGNVSSDGGSAVTVRGICISTVANPTTGDTYVTADSGTGFFTGILTGLLPATLYHVRAFARNANGISYGTDVTFTTLAPSPYVYNWYLPSKEEFREAYIKVLGANKGTPLKTGTYPSSLYWTSSDDHSTYYDGLWHDTWLQAWGYVNSFGGGLGIHGKADGGHVRAVADFISTTVYAVKDAIPGGAFVYKLENLGGGSFHYWIVAPTDADTVRINWSSVNTTPAGPVPTDTPIGTGGANTAAIIAQHGVGGTSAAKIAINYLLP